jgi:hypothetical protein
MNPAAAMDPPPPFVRFESGYPNCKGDHVGIFGLVNVLGRHGMLTPVEEANRQLANAWYDDAYLDPSSVDPSIYDPTINPRAAAWFKTSAQHLLERVPLYLHILDAHNVVWRRREAANPGFVIYEDLDQVIALPWTDPSPDR